MFVPTHAADADVVLVTVTDVMFQNDTLNSDVTKNNAGKGCGLEIVMNRSHNVGKGREREREREVISAAPTVTVNTIILTSNTLEDHTWLGLDTHGSLRHA